LKKWTLVDQALAPDGSTISLYEHDGSYAIRAGSVELMSTRQHASEEKIAELACAHVRATRRARVLVGGLGFGFTLKATLKSVAGDATVVVAEILAAVIAWNRNDALPLAAAALADRRVTVVQQDVGEVIRGAKGSFDSIILDVDNGPAALSTAGNRQLYTYKGLQQVRTALRPAGCAAFWSAAPDEAFERLLSRAGFAVEVHRSRAHFDSGGWRTLFVGRVR
jgi:spermidine synthase